jgi:hypothetical protein
VSVAEGISLTGVVQCFRGFNKCSSGHICRRLTPLELVLCVGG